MPTPREELANLLRESRIRAGYKSHGAFAKVLHKSRPVVSKAESPINPVPSDDVLAGWVELTGVDPDVLNDVAVRARSRPAQWFVPWEVIEACASVIRWFSLMLMPGLLQTEAYAREVLTWKPYRANAEANLKNRLARQAVLDRAEIRVLILESVLYREVGDASTMAEQIDYLLEVGARPNVTLQVVPDIPQVAGALGGAFAIATEGSADVALYTESIIRGTVHTDADMIASAACVFDALRAEALPWTQTQERLRRARAMYALNWRKASRSAANGGDCVEVADHDGAVLIRDTKQHGHGQIHRFTAADWRHFVDTIKSRLQRQPEGRTKLSPCSVGPLRCHLA